MFTLRCLRRKQTALIKYHIRKASSRYQRSMQFFFKKNLLLTNSITSGGCMVIGDIIQQEIEFFNQGVSSSFDTARLTRMFIVGTLLGPFHHYYYIYLDILEPKVTIKTAFFKVVCDQMIASPLTLLGFFYGMGYLENKSLSQCNTEIADKFFYAYLGDFVYWPPVQFINFYFLPTEYRVVYINAATAIFNVFLSFMKHYDQ